MMKISAILAMSKNRVIGIQNRLPWKLPEDLRRFRVLTEGHGVIMGRKTFESIGKALPHRKNVILTRQPSYSAPGAIVVPSLKKAFEACEGYGSELFVIGGAEIYSLAFPYFQRIYLTLVHQNIEGDTFFPEIPSHEFQEMKREDLHSGEVLLSFLIFDRILKSE